MNKDMIFPPGNLILQNNPSPYLGSCQHDCAARDRIMGEMWLDAMRLPLVWAVSGRGLPEPSFLFLFLFFNN